MIQTFAAQTIPVSTNPHSNIIQVVIVDGKIRKKDEIEYNKDGLIKKRCNKESGKSSEVYAFKTEKEIADMIKVFNRRIENATNENQKQIAVRNKMLFLIGINVGIRAGDLRTLKWSFFFERNNNELKFKESYILQPEKQKKQNKFVKLFFNQTVQKIINDYISEYPVENLDDYLFPSRKGNEPIKVSSLWEIIKDAAAEAGITQNIGSHSLRKTWGFWVWHNAEDKNKALVILQQCFSHSSTQTTMRYIGLLEEEIKDMYLSVELGFENL